jgi:exodeoxyribonuclease VIII
MTLTNTLERQITYNLSDADYRAFKAVSKSSLDWLVKSPAHYKHVVIDGNRPEPTAAMETGKAFDSLLLTPSVFHSEYVQAPDIRRGTKAWTEFEEAHQGKTLLKPDEWNRIHAMRDSVMNNATAAELLLGAKTQVSFKWADEETELLCKGRADLVTSDGILCDVKSTSDGSLEGFSKSIASFGYHRQAAMYLDGLGDSVGDQFYFICVEKEPPYLTAVYCLDRDAVRAGRQEYKSLLRRLQHCQNTNNWPGYSVGTQSISLPGWYSKGVENV